MRHRIFLQSSFGNIISHNLAPSEGARLEAAGEADHIIGMVNRRYQIIGYQFKKGHLMREDRSSPCAITPGEMMANAGLHNSAGYVHMVQTKVQIWGEMTREFRSQITVSA